MTSLQISYGLRLHHQGANQAQNRVEFRKSGVNQCVGEHIVALAHTDDTVSADLTLADEIGRAHV